MHDDVGVSSFVEEALDDDALGRWQPTQGGAGSAVNEYLVSRGITQRILNYGLPDRLLQHGSQQDMLEDARLTREGLLEFINKVSPPAT